MITNKYLRDLYAYNDRDLSLSQLIDHLINGDSKFIENILKDLVDFNKCDRKEIEFLMSASAIIDCYMQINNLEIPSWVRDAELSDKTSLYSNDLSKFKYSNYNS